jgi:hypothetical protein
MGSAGGVGKIGGPTPALVRWPVRVSPAPAQRGRMVSVASAAGSLRPGMRAVGCDGAGHAMHPEPAFCPGASLLDAADARHVLEPGFAPGSGQRHAAAPPPSVLEDDEVDAPARVVSGPPIPALARANVVGRASVRASAVGLQWGLGPLVLPELRQG